MPNPVPAQSGTHARNEGPGGCVPWEQHHLLMEAVGELLFHYEDEEREHGFPFNFSLRASHRKLAALHKLLGDD